MNKLDSWTNLTLFIINYLIDVIVKYIYSRSGKFPSATVAIDSDFNFSRMREDNWLLLAAAASYSACVFWPIVLRFMIYIICCQILSTQRKCKEVYNSFSDA